MIAVGDDPLVALGYERMGEAGRGYVYMSSDDGDPVAVVFRASGVFKEIAHGSKAWPLPMTAAELRAAADVLDALSRDPSVALMP